MKKLLTLVFCMQMAFSAIAAPWDGTTAASYAGGAGTLADPYQIATAEQLAYLASQANAAGQTTNGNTSGKYYKLTADIDLNGPTKTWTPIGSTSTTAFAGIFDGDNHIISNIYINSTAVNQGLFGYLQGTSVSILSAIVKNVTIGSGSITTTQSYAAGIAARCQYAQISNCKNAIPVIGLSYSAGIVGRADGVSIIEYCGNTGAIKSTQASNSYTAGIAASFQALATNGASDKSYVRNCYNRGAVNAVSYSGGIIGNGHGYLTIDKCFNTAAITLSGGGSGGIIGYGYTNTNGVLDIKNCYNTGLIKASATVAATNCAGGILGYVGSANTRFFGTILNCYNTGSITGNVKEPIAGQLYGATGGGTGTVTNSYFLASSGINTIANDGTSVADAATLQGYASTLNNSQDPTVWSADVNPNFNGGYPVLSWVTSYAKLTAPTVQTPTNITSTSFTANWTAVPNAIGYYINVYKNDATGAYVTSQYAAGQATTSASFTSGLTSNTSHIYKVIAVSPSGTTYIDSEESASFVVGLGGATVLTNSFAPASTTSVTINCNIPAYSVGTVTARGICYSTSTQSPSITNTLVTDATGGNGDYSVTMSSLLENTFYYFRAYATTSTRTNYSVTGSFKILSAPSVTTGATNISTSGFTANWAAVASVSSYDIKVYDNTLAQVGTTTNVVSGTLSLGITGLSPNTAYTYTVTAKGNGTTFLNSAESATAASFNTLQNAPTITSFTPTSAGNGATVTITGTNLTGASAVSFGGTVASIISNTATEITAVVATGTSGDVSVTTAGGTITESGFVWLEAPTNITNTKTAAELGLTASSSVTVSTNGTLNVGIIDVSSTTNLNSLTATGGGKVVVNQPLIVAGNVTVENDAAINLTNTIAINGNLDLKADRTTSFSVNLGSSSISVPTGTFRYLKTIDDTKWYFISFPCIVPIAQIQAVGGTAGALNTEWFIKYYNGQQRANVGADGTNWIALTDNTASLEANKGYIFGLNSNTGAIKEIAFPLDKAILSGENLKTSVPVSVNTGTATPTNHGWNLVGQPYLSKYDVAGAGVDYIYFVKQGGMGYDQYLKAFDPTKIVDPFTSYFVQSLGNTSISFNTSLRKVSSVVATDISDKLQINFSSVSGTDRTNIIMDNNMSSEYVMGQDLEKWLGATSAIYTIIGGINYALNSLPFTSVNNLPLAYYSQLAGAASISVNASQAPGLSHLLLKDKVTGITTDLLQSDYTFTATAGTDNTRFAITAQRIPTASVIETDIDTLQLSIVNCQLFIKNLSPNSNVRVFDAIGRIVANKTVSNNTLHINLSAKGMYTVQIEAGGKSLVKKIVN